ncbi:DUF2793 domain-containing protein (plasmid) [Halorarum halophilum]|uniref:DUF2793 domain-containing protein n=1 Tax=Halorarum halophilum TaxID=2743090 RepID=A0A7D5GF11_9EURY|nr:DUF2793 domain-containing protein [Halobaculum halophilum]QLG30186.1 DUF2793 domain-containing protein [Halobaculum halophilum]
MPTPNHDLDAPAAASTSWKKNFNYIDVHLMLQGTKANRPAAGTSDRLYLATDEGIIYRDTGAGWTNVLDEATTSAIGYTDDTLLTWGDDDDFATQFASANNQWELIDQTGTSSELIAHVPAGGSFTLDRGLDLNGQDLADGATTIWNASAGYIPSARVQGLDTHTSDASAHHTKYSDAEAVSAINSESSLTVDITGDADTVDGYHASDFSTSAHTHSHGDLTGIGVDDHHIRYADEEAQDAIGTIIDGSLSYVDSPASLGVASGGITSTHIAPDAVGSSELVNDSVTVTAGTLLTGGGLVALGGTVSLDVDEGSIDHGSISGIGDDDHTQYVPTDASRGFTNPVSGIDPSTSSDLATKSYVDSIAQGIEYRESVLDTLNTPPGTPSTGDRYLVGSAPSGDWSGHADELAEYDGSGWTFETPNEGWAVFVEDVDMLLVFNATSWVSFGSTLDHGALQGLGDDDHTQYLLASGARSMAGSLNMGSNAITNVSTVDGVDVSAHAGNASAHHAKYTDTEAVAAVNAETTLSVDISGDADTVDGQHASAFATAGHVHAHGDLTGIGSSDHHARYADEEARDAVGSILSADFNYDDVANTIDLSPHTGDSGAHHARYADEEAQDAVGSMVDGTLVYDDATPSLGVADNSITITHLAFDPATQAELSSHTGDSTNPHSVTVSQIGAIPDSTDAVTSTHIAANSVGTSELSFDPTTQSEFDTHTGSASAHHAKYTDTEAVSAVESEVGLTFAGGLTINGTFETSGGGQFGSGISLDGTNPPGANKIEGAGGTLNLDRSASVAVEHSGTAFSFDVVDTGNANTLLTVDGGGTVDTPDATLFEQGSRVATRTWANSNFAASGHAHAHADLTGISSSDHHTRYADAEAVAAVNAETSLSVDITGDADTLDGVQLAAIDWTNVAMSQSDVSVSDLGPADTNFDLNGNDIVSSNSFSINQGGNQRVHFGIDTTINNTDLQLGPGVDLKSGTTILWDEAAGHIPSARVQGLDTHTSDASAHHTRPTAGNGLSDTTDTFSVDESYDFTFSSEIDFSGGLALGAALNAASNSINSVGTLNVSDITSNNGTGPITVADVGFEYADDLKVFYGTDSDFSIAYDSVEDELVVHDETTGIDLIRQPKAGPTQFIQGIESGTIETPEDTNIQIINTPVTSNVVGGTLVGHTLSVNSQTALALRGTADGGGGLSDGPYAELGGDLRATDGEVIWDEVSSHIPQGRLQNDTVTVAGNVVALGGSTSVAHSDLTGIGSADHHARYTDSEALAAVNADADHGSTAQHDYFTTENAQDAIGTIVDGTLSYDDATPSLGVAASSITTSHLAFDPATQAELNTHEGDSSAHHTRYADSEAVAAVNAETTLSVDISGDADTLDGVHLAGIDWGNTALDQSEVNVSHLGAADANLNMNGKQLTGVSQLKFTDRAADTNAWYLEEDTTSGALMVREDRSSGTFTAFKFSSGYHFETLVGEIREQGNRVATRTWTNSNFATNGHGHAHADLTGIGASDHHTRYADSEAVAAVNAEASLTVDITGDADTLDGVHLASIDWADVAMAQSDVNVSHLGSANATLDMNGNDVSNVEQLSFIEAGNIVANVDESHGPGAPGAVFDVTIVDSGAADNIQWMRDAGSARAFMVYNTASGLGGVFTVTDTGNTTIAGSLTVESDITDGLATIWDASAHHVPSSSVQGLNSHTGDSSAHHAKYTDTEAVAAVNAETTLSVNISGDADTLDGVHLANIDWADVAMAQSDVNVSDLGTADATLDMGNNDITSINGFVFQDPGPDGSVRWSNWQLYEAPNDLSNVAGNFQIVNNGTRVVTVEDGTGQLEATGGYKAGDFEIVENSERNSLDFNYTGS